MALGAVDTEARQLEIAKRQMRVELRLMRLPAGRIGGKISSVRLSFE